MDLDMIWYLCSSIVNFCAAGPPSPARPSTPQSRSSPVPPPPPPRPSSRPKLPPGKPISDLVRMNFPIISLSLFCLVSFTMLNNNVLQTALSPGASLQSAGFRQPSTFRSPGPCRELFVYLLHYLPECSFHADTREGPEHDHCRYTIPFHRLLVSARMCILD